MLHFSFVETIELSEMKEIIVALYEIAGMSTENAETNAEAIFNQLDIDGDGEITKEEFMRACMGSDKIITILAYKMLDLCMTDCA